MVSTEPPQPTLSSTGPPTSDPPSPPHSIAGPSSSSTFLTLGTITLPAPDQQPGSPPSFPMPTSHIHQQDHQSSPNWPTPIPTPLLGPTPHPMTTRAKIGIYKPNSRYFSNFSAMATTTISPLPKDPASAIRDPHWKIAMLDEFNALIDNKTWELVPRPPDLNVIRSM